MLFQLPRGCRVFKKLEPATEWGYDEIFLNKIVYLLDTIVWQNGTPTKAGEKAKHKQQQPKLFIPTFMKNKETKDGIAKDTVSLDVDEVKDILSRPRK